ncbi:MAG: DUF3604 domain-containing protein [Pseudomonadales bacterium]
MLLAGCMNGEADSEEISSAPQTQKNATQQAKSTAVKQLYFGDLHVHTSVSLDAFLWGNRYGVEEAYLFAKGEPITLASGDVAQISRPLDFIAITDHASSFETNAFCNADEISAADQARCDRFSSPSNELFEAAMKKVRQRPVKRGLGFCSDDKKRCLEASKKTWKNMQASAQEYYAPGEFTTFAAYEFSPALAKQGKIHRNVFFRGSSVPDHVVSVYEAATEIDLWKDLNDSCVGDCQYLTIPHNLNLTWGYAFAMRTIDGDLYTDEDLQLRADSEPLVEIIQAKGASECAVGLGANDEECNFEQMVEPCPEGQIDACGLPGSFAREGLKRGLALAEEKGFNPYKVGFIGSTDTHNSTPGDTEEIDYQGTVGMLDNTPAKRHNRDKPRFSGLNRTPLNYSAGGLAAVWAEKNTRESLFDAMKRREVFATSGTRLSVRVFADWNLNSTATNSANAIADLSQSAVPMGGDLSGAAQGMKPDFLVWANKDPDSVNLQRIQMIKGWLDKGERKEQVIDIACSDDLTPDPVTQRCPDNGATVDLQNCAASTDRGAAELKAVWTDNNFDPKQRAFYYVRVLENPSCRWSTYNALRLGKAPKPQVDVTINERAWSSPIWYTP